MSAPDPDGMTLLAKVLAAGAAVITPLWGAHKWMEGRLDKKADKEHVNKSFSDVTAELSNQRINIGKLFDQIRQNEQRAQDRHERLMDKFK